MSSVPINYAKETGIQSVPAAVAFCLAYVPFFIFNLVRFSMNRSYVLFILTFFCAVRIAAFALRAALAGILADAENEDMLIAQQIIYSVGFFGLIYASYALVVDRRKVSGLEATNIIERISGNLQLIRLACTAAVALGVAGACEASLSSTASDVSLGKELKKVSTIMFLVLCVLLLVQTLFTMMRSSEINEKGYAGSTAGQRNGISILAFVALLLVIKEAFFTATLNNLSAQYNELLFYPLSAAPELIAVAMFVIPGLVPLNSELPR